MKYVSRVRVLIAIAVIAAVSLPATGCDEDDGPTAPEQCATPRFTPPGGRYGARLSVAILCDTPLSTIRYTTDETIPVETSSEYLRPIQVTGDATILARAWRDGYTPSELSTALYIIKPYQVATPTFEPPPGEYVGGQWIRIECSTDQVRIRYTLNGSDPTPISPMYSEPFGIAENTTIKAKAWRTEWYSSEIAVGRYTIGPVFYVSTPTFDPPPGSYVAPQLVAISCETEGATIRYTTQGSYPNESSHIYERRFVVSDNMMIRARALKTGMEPSGFARACYSIESGTTEPELFLSGIGGSPAGYDPTVLWLDNPDFAASTVSSEVLGPSGNATEVANDFVLEQPATIQKVIWWGTYWNGFVAPRPSGFNLRFYLDAVCRPEADPFLEYLLPGDRCQEELAPGGDGISQFIYEYCVEVPLDAGVYWLSIQMADYCHMFPPQWGRPGADRTINCPSCIRSEHFGFPQWAPIDSIIGADYEASVMLEDECLGIMAKPTSWPSVKLLYR